jgi:REP element-mobilizing transposase RayT
MARKPREISSSGVYHIMLRGINKKCVFHEKSDETKFLEILTDLKVEYDFEVYAYCFMYNHVHIMLKESESGLISKFMKILLVRYVGWYNVAHHRCGSLFQSRFKSEPVDSAKYFQQLVRYIHRNPVKAGKCKHVWQYQGSSYRAFFAEDSGIIDRDKVFEFIDPAEFEQFNDSQTVNGFDDNCLDLNEAIRFRVTDERATKIMQSVSGLFDLSLFGSMDVDLIRKLVRKFRQQCLSYGQIARAIQRNKGSVYHWVNRPLPFSA